MKEALIIGLLILTLNSFSQNNINDKDFNIEYPILTFEQNEKWIDYMCSLNKMEILVELRQRILSDTNTHIERVHYMVGTGERSTTYTDSSKVLTEGVPVYVFDNYPLYFNSDALFQGISDNSLISFIASCLNSDNIDNVECLNCSLGDTVQAIYGTKSIFGIFFIKTKFNKNNNFFKYDNFEFQTTNAKFSRKFKFSIKTNKTELIEIYLENPFNNSTEIIFTGEITGIKKFVINTSKEKGNFIILRFKNEKFTKRLLIRRKQ